MTDRQTDILLLSNNNNAALFADRLKAESCNVNLYHDPISVDTVKAFSPDLVISYNYSHIVKRDVIELLGDKIINMHVSLLPWNKGSSPNIWSFIDNTPKGVTIHRLEAGLDTGKIMFQKELFFDEDKETLSSSYQKLQEAIVDLFIENFESIRTLDFPLIEPQSKGSYHKTADLIKLLNGKQIDYNMTISEFKEFINQK
ncbi:MAG: formyl transferase [Clostridiales bacterium]|nr:formyl transferase [Clostridiales bacterium]